MYFYRDPEYVAILRETLRRFVEQEMPRELAQQWDKEDYFPRDVFDKLSELGVMGLGIEEKHGGSGREIVACMAVIEELARRSCAVAVPYIMAACYAGMNINEVGSKTQKASLLPKVAEGKMLFAYGISEPDTGSDVAGVRTTAVRSGENVIINGAKRFCSGAPICDYIYTVVKSHPAAPRYENLSIVLIPPGSQGITIENQATMGMKGASTCDVTFTDVKVPAENIVGGEAGWNRGWPMIVGPGLDVEKIEVAALSLGIAAAAVDDAWYYAQERKQFGKAICSFQAVRHTLAEVKTQLEACRLMTYQAAALIEKGEDAGVATSMAKLFVCDLGKEIVLKCQQIFGAYGYVRELDVERYVRDSLLMPIIGGSSAIQKNNISNRLGLPHN